MQLIRIFKIVGALLFVIAVAGCGSEGNSNTNGTLTLTADASVLSGVTNLTAKASLTPAQLGSQVTFSAIQYGYNSTTKLVETVASTGSITLSTDPQGNTSPWAVNFPPITTMDTTLEVTATSGALFDIKRISILKYVP